MLYTPIKPAAPKLPTWTDARLAAAYRMVEDVYAKLTPDQRERDYASAIFEALEAIEAADVAMARGA